MDKTVVDIIILVDESVNMNGMRDELIKSINTFVIKQKENKNYMTKLSFVTFSDKVNYIINNVTISNTPKITKDDYIPVGNISYIYDAVCTTISRKLIYDKPEKSILIVITNGSKNAGLSYTSEDVKEYIKIVKEQYQWNIMFFHMDNTLNINQEICIQFSPEPNDLLTLMTSVSENIATYCRSISENNTAVLKMPNRYGRYDIMKYRSSVQSPIPKRLYESYRLQS